MTPREIRCLDFIRDTIAATGSSPTYDRIAAHMGNKGKGGVAMLVDELVRRGLLERRRYRRNGLRVVGQANLATIPTAALRAELARRDGIAGA